MNVFDIYLKDHRQDHELLLMLNGSIWEAVVLVQVHVQWTHVEEGEQEDVHFHMNKKPN
jgi:hypothetical protein